MKIRILEVLFAAALFSAFPSCEKQRDEPSAVDFISRITVSSVEDNSLRLNVDIDFKKACDYTVSYWKSSDKSGIQTTKVRHTDGEHARVTLMFLYPETEYRFKVNFGEDGEVCSDEYEFTTGQLPAAMPVYIMEKAERELPGYIFQTQISKPGYIAIADLDGTVIWYQFIDEASRMFDLQLEQGRIWLLTGFKEGSSGDFQRLTTHIRCIDLYGNEIHRWSTKTGEIDIPYAHHEVRQMPDGNIVVVNNVTKQFDLSSIGGGSDVTIYGDGFTIFNEQGEIVRKWDVFEELGDITTCSYVMPLKREKDLMHANSFNWDSEGNYYMTFNHSSQLWKIDAATGKVLYRVGPDGNVTMDEAGYANGLHCAMPLAPDRVLCLDNGRGTQQSRAIIYNIDPSTMTATVDLSVTLDTGYSSRDRSNAQLIIDGKVLMFGLTDSHYVVFTDLEGNVLRSLQRTGMSYRTGYIEKLPEY